MSRVLQTLASIIRHPLNRTNRIAALRRFVFWQIGSRLVPGPIAIPFVDSTHLLVSRGMTGATGNVYCGLHEFEDMALVLHTLRPGDLFADIGANVGSYTILASGAAGADCLAFEPIPLTFTHLLANIRLNNLGEKVFPKNIGLGSAPGFLNFTTKLDPMNHVLTVTDSESTDGAISVPVAPLDDVLAGASLTLMKIDVEGFEAEVINGAREALCSPSLLAVIMEVNGCGARYGFDEAKLHSRMLDLGFLPTRYEPIKRELFLLSAKNIHSGNTLYVRELEQLRERVHSAPRHYVHGVSL